MLGAFLLLAAAWFAEFPGVRVPVNENEARVAPYDLEDPLTFFDGRKVADASLWPARRQEILGLFEREMYGKRPPLPETLVTELADEKVTVGGFAIRRQYDMWFRADRTGPKIRWIVWLPRDASGRVPVILWLNSHGNHTLVRDPDIPLMTAWHRNGKYAKDNRVLASTRGLLQDPDQPTVFPIGMLLARGYAVMSACYCEVSPDPNRTGEEDPRPQQDALAYAGVFDLWPKRDPEDLSGTTSLGAWSWALSRGLDLAGRIPEVDAHKSVVTGCSRLGKAALLAAVSDERFAVCAPVQTGNGGVPLAKRDFGENPATETRQFTHWFCRAYEKYREKPWKTLTFDQHLLVSTIAPRALLVLGFTTSPWFDCRGEYLSCRAASCVWELLCGEGLPAGTFPPAYSVSAIGGRLGYACRRGRHGISAQDWTWIVDFADRQFGKATGGRKPPRTDLQWQIDEAAAHGGGRVVVPSGRHVTGGLVLKSNVELHLEEGAVLEGSPRTNDYPVVELPYSEGAWMAVVLAVGATNVAVTGRGEIFGNGTAFPRAQGKLPPGVCQEGTRPRGLFFGNCRNVRLEDFTLRDTACWGCVIQCCEGVAVRRLTIDNHANYNNDGIDIEARNAVIDGCDIDAGDDGVCLKSNNPHFTVENILVTNCVIRSHCVPFKIGTATHGVVRNVVFVRSRTEAPRRDFDCSGTPLGFRPANWRPWCEKDFPGSVVGEPAAASAIAVVCTDGGAVEDVVCRDVVIDGGCYVPIFVRANRRLRRTNGVPRGKYDVMRNLLFENVRGHSLSAVPSSVAGLPDFRIENVRFRNVRLIGRGGGENEAERTRPVPERAHNTPSAGMYRQALPASGLWARHVDALTVEDSEFSLAAGDVDRRESVVLDDVK